MPRFFVLSIWGVCSGASVLGHLHEDTRAETFTLGIRIVGSRIYRIFALFCAGFAHAGGSRATGMRTDWLKVR